MPPGRATNGAVGSISDGVLDCFGHTDWCCEGTQPVCSRDGDDGCLAPGLEATRQTLLS